MGVQKKNKERRKCAGKEKKNIIFSICLDENYCVYVRSICNDTETALVRTMKGD